MRLPVVFALAVGFVALAALTPATGCARKSEPPPSPLVEKGRGATPSTAPPATVRPPTATPPTTRRRCAPRPSSRRRRTTSCARASAAGGPAPRWPRYARALGGPLDPPTRWTQSSPSCARRAGPRALPEGRSSATPSAARWSTRTTARAATARRPQRSRAVHLANPVLLATASDEFLRWAVERGRPPTSMVPWKGALAPRQIDDVVAFVRSMAVPPAAPALPAAAAQPAAPLPPRRADRAQPEGQGAGLHRSRRISTSRSRGQEGARREAAAHHRGRARPLRLAEPAHHGRHLDALLRREPSTTSPTTAPGSSPTAPVRTTSRARSSTSCASAATSTPPSSTRASSPGNGAVSGRRRARPAAGARAAAAASLSPGERQRNKPRSPDTEPAELRNGNRANRKPRARPVSPRLRLTRERGFA